jgi:hypothetical protein
VLSIAGILQVLHKTDGEEKWERGLLLKGLKSPRGEKIPGPEIMFQGRNSAPGPEFPPLDKISGGRKFHEFPALRNSAKSSTKCCGATLCKGARNSGLAEFPGAGNSINFRPSKIRLSPLQKVVVQLSSKGPEILPGARNSRISGPCDFSLSPLSRAVVQLSVKGPEFLAGNSSLEFLAGNSSLEFPRAGISALSLPRNFRPLARISGVSFLQRADFELAYK